MLLEKLLFHLPCPNSRDHPCFYLNVARTNVHLFSPLHSMCHNYNLFRHKFDLFNTNVYEIKRITSTYNFNLFCFFFEVKLFMGGF
jgi:hypothetical protein